MLPASVKRYAWLSVAAAIATIGLKTVAWWLTGSVGLLSDAIESLVNLAGALMALAMLSIAMQPPDDEHAHGHGKAEYFSSAFEGFLIAIAAAGIAYAAIERLFAPRPLDAVGRRARDQCRRFRNQSCDGPNPHGGSPGCALDRPGSGRAAPDGRRVDLGRRRHRRGARSHDRLVMARSGNRAGRRWQRGVDRMEAHAAIDRGTHGRFVAARGPGTNRGRARELSSQGTRLSRPADAPGRRARIHNLAHAGSRPVDRAGRRTTGPSESKPICGGWCRTVTSRRISSLSKIRCRNSIGISIVRRRDYLDLSRTWSAARFRISAMRCCSFSSALRFSNSAALS